MKVRSLNQQFQYAISRQVRIGTSKRAQKKDGIKTIKHTYSVNSTKQLRRKAKSLAEFLNKNYPEIRLVKDIKSVHIQNYIDQRYLQWSQKTAQLNKHLIKKLTIIVNTVYYLNLNFEDVIYIRRKTPRVKNNPMSPEDFLKFARYTFENSRSIKLIPLITASTGTRVEEVVSLLREDIHLKERYIHLRNCKNGKKRDVPIREEYLKLWEYITEFLDKNNWETACNNLSYKSVITLLAKVKRKLNLNYPFETNHTIRKLYARHRFYTEYKKSGDPKRSWEIVQVELGHGPLNREDLFERYIGINYNLFLKEINE